MAIDPTKMAQQLLGATKAPTNSSLDTELGHRFMLALMAVGRGNCDCKTCQLLRPILDKMEESLS